MASVSPAQLERILTSSADLSKASLATRILITRLRLEVKTQPAALRTKVSELQNFCAARDYAAAELASL